MQPVDDLTLATLCLTVADEGIKLDEATLDLDAEEGTVMGDELQRVLQLLTGGVLRLRVLGDGIVAVVVGSEDALHQLSTIVAVHAGDTLTDALPTVRRKAAYSVGVVTAGMEGPASANGTVVGVRWHVEQELHACLTVAKDAVVQSDDTHAVVVDAGTPQPAVLVPWRGPFSVLVENAILMLQQQPSPSGSLVAQALQQVLVVVAHLGADLTWGHGVRKHKVQS